MQDESTLEKIAVAALFIACVALMMTLAYWF